MKLIVPSKGRSDTIGKHTLALMPWATVLVDEDEAEDYEGVVPAGQLMTHPGITPIVKILNWVLDTVVDDVVVIADDDITALIALPGWRVRRYRDPDVARGVLEGTAQCAMDAGAGLFGFNQNDFQLYFDPQEPFRLARWIGSVIGFVGDHGLRYDENCSLHEDADLALQALMRQRIVWCDNRWRFTNLRFTNAGGNTGHRTKAREEAEREYLKEKWGRYIRFSFDTPNAERQQKGIEHSTTVLTSLRVPRKQMS